jgi:hypothetical protein
MKRVSPPVVAWCEDPPPLPTRHPLRLDLWVDGQPGLVLERYENALLARAEAGLW